MYPVDLTRVNYNKLLDQTVLNKLFTCHLFWGFNVSIYNCISLFQNVSYILKKEFVSIYLKYIDT